MAHVAHRQEKRATFVCSKRPFEGSDDRYHGLLEASSDSADALVTALEFHRCNQAAQSGCFIYRRERL